MDDALKDRLRKILHLMENAGSQGEAEAAAAAFQRMMLKYNLDDETVESLKAKKSQFVTRWISIARPRTPGIGWRVSLYTVIARGQFCEVLLPGHGGWHNFWVVGEDANIDAVNAFFTVAVDTFVKLEEVAWQSVPSFLRPNRRTFTSSYMIGVASGIQARLYEERKEYETDDTKALVLVKTAALDDEVKRIAGGASKAQGYEVTSVGAWRAGFRDGKAYQSAEGLETAGVKALEG